MTAKEAKEKVSELRKELHEIYKRAGDEGFNPKDYTDIDYLGDKIYRTMQEHNL